MNVFWKFKNIYWASMKFFFRKKYLSRYLSVYGRPPLLLFLFSMKVYAYVIYLNRIFMLTCFTRIERFFLSSIKVLYGRFLCKKDFSENYDVRG